MKSKMSHVIHTTDTCACIQASNTQTRNALILILMHTFIHANLIMRAQKIHLEYI